ncbi:MAG: helix-turn-helix transcriptional regulator [Anaerolineales bacterium]|nr:MAG: helix-turn-helix transcriptional regulator [Anaerolineales bacterium]
MSDEFPKLLKELRTKARISQMDLADMLKISRALVSSWEDGSDLPSRNIIKNISKELRLNTVDIDKLLSSAGYEKLTGEEVVNLINENLSSVGLVMGGQLSASHDELSRLFNSTGAVMGGTINSLDEKVKSIETKLDSILGLAPNKNPEIMEEIENRMRPIMLEVQAIRQDVVPQLETTKTQLSKTDEFLRKNADFFITAVEGEGAVKVVSKEVDSLEKRLSKVEDQINVTRNRTIAMVSGIVATVSMCIACISLGLFAYATFVTP